MALRTSQKMFLVAPHQLNRLTQPESSIRQTAEDDLDAKIKAILNEPGLSSYENITKYNTLLQKYLTLMKQGQKEERRVTLTLQRDLRDDPTDQAEPHYVDHLLDTQWPDPDDTLSEVIKSLPPRDRKNAEYIMKKLSKSKAGWNSKGEFIHKGHERVSSD